ncbi:MAG: hypothetical protein UHD09_09370 [Bifidobacterium sp.]|nr:hypothetical protein [Bifidobacterium sp.]
MKTAEIQAQLPTNIRIEGPVPYETWSYMNEGYVRAVSDAGTENEGKVYGTLNRHSLEFIAGADQNVCLPRQIFATNLEIPEDPRFTVSLFFEWDAVTFDYVPTYMALRPLLPPNHMHDWAKPQIDGTLLRSIKFEDYKTHALSSCLLLSKAENNREAEDPELCLYDYAGDLLHAQMTREENGGKPDLKEIAKLYAVATVITRKPREVLTTAFDISTVTASSWVKRAREAGYYTGFTREEREAHAAERKKNGMGIAEAMRQSGGNPVPLSLIGKPKGK